MPHVKADGDHFGTLTLEYRPERLAAYANADGHTIAVPMIDGKRHTFFVYASLTTNNRDIFEIRVGASGNFNGPHLILDNSHTALQDFLGSGGRLDLKGDTIEFGGNVYDKIDDDFTLDPEHIICHNYPE